MLIFRVAFFWFHVFSLVPFALYFSLCSIFLPVLFSINLRSLVSCLIELFVFVDTNLLLDRSDAITKGSAASSSLYTRLSYNKTKLASLVIGGIFNFPTCILSEKVHVIAYLWILRGDNTLEMVIISCTLKFSGLFLTITDFRCHFYGFFLPLCQVAAY